MHFMIQCTRVESVIRLFQFAIVCKKEGNNVNLFLTDDIVNLSRPSQMENFKMLTGDDFLTYAKAAYELGIPVKLCKPCCSSREVEQLPFNWEIGTMAQFVADIRPETHVIIN